MPVQNIPSENARKAWMSLLAKADDAGLAQAMEAIEAPAHSWLRPPEIGSVMVQGRAGATGAPFCLGEMTVTRCTLKLDSGEVGHAVVQGRSKAKAEQAALVDALMQGPRGAELEEKVLAPLRDALGAAKRTRAAKAAATKVDFFTLVRGDN